ncbi:MAG TPA: hypothetical protein PKI03_09930 [Pseudomonadota bacterium]|nr:hypothetical protein [Pseudomonadota bacterium]
MGFFSRLRSAWQAVIQSDPADAEAASRTEDDGEDDAPDAGSAPATAASDALYDDSASPKEPRANGSPDSGAVKILAGTIDDYNATTRVGLVTLSDGATIGFGAEVCEGFTPLLGLRVAIFGTGVPPESFHNEVREAPDDLPGLWASRMLLFPGSESEYAARLRIHQVERALRGAGERDGPSAPGEPPWARGKNRPGRKPSGPGRPHDAFFTLTLVLDRELPQDAAALSRLIDPSPRPAISLGPVDSSERAPSPCGLWRHPSVRIIPLIRNKQTEPGFSAELQSGSHRAFLLYRPQPYGAESQCGRAHVGLFVGGPHTPRIAAQLSGRNDQPPVAVTNEAARILADLARALLLAHPEAPGMVLNRAGKAFKSREIALSQLGETASEQVPFVAWIDWNRGEHEGRPCLLSSGLEILALPDIAVALPSTPASARPPGDDDAAEVRARDVMLFVCDLMLRGLLPDDASTIAVPRHIRLQPGSRLEIAEPHDCETYAISARSPDWIELLNPADGGAATDHS